MASPQTEPKVKWLTAREFFNTGQDPLHGKRRSLRAAHGNSVRDVLVQLMPVTEIAAALGEDREVAKTRVMAENGKVEVMRIRADLIGFLKALRLRHIANTGEDISLPNVVSLVALYGAQGILDLPEFAPNG